MCHELTLDTLWWNALAEDPQNLVLEHLRYIRSATDQLCDDVAIIKQRLGHVEVNLAHVQVTVAEQSVRLDKFDARLGRIEKRLELAEA